MLAKIGPGREHHLAAAGGRIFLNDVGAGDVRRHQVGRELDAVELQVEHLRHRVDQQRLGQAGHADDQAVAADEEREQGLADDFVLADDELFQLGDDLLAALLHPVRQRDIVLLQVFLSLVVSTKSSSLRQMSQAAITPFAEQQREQQKQNHRHVPQVAFFHRRDAAARVLHIVGQRRDRLRRVKAAAGFFGDAAQQRRAHRGVEILAVARRHAHVAHAGAERALWRASASTFAS